MNIFASIFIFLHDGDDRFNETAMGTDSIHKASDDPAAYEIKIIRMIDAVF